MKKRIVSSAFSIISIVTVAMIVAVPQAKAANVIVHDDPTDPVVTSQSECSEMIYAEDAVLTGTYSVQSEGNVWLRGLAYGSPTATATVTFTLPGNRVCIQFHSSDNNDGVADIYVDDMSDPVTRVDAYMRGHWYVEIRGLLPAQHTVRVKPSENYDFSDVIVSPHHAEPDIDSAGDLDVWYFCSSQQVVPTLSEWGLIAFGMLLLTAMAWALRRRQVA